MEKEVNVLKDTTEVIKNEIVRMKKAQEQMSNNISEEIEKSEERTEK